MSSRVAVIVSGFPRRSETFMLGELLALEASGVLAAVLATKAGEPGAVQPGTEKLAKYVEFLPEAPVEEQARAVRQILERKAVGGIHGYFAHRPAEVAQQAAQMLGIPFGFSIHARDLRKVAPETLTERAGRAACVITCNTDVAQDTRDLGAPVHLLPHGVDLQRFRPPITEINSTLRLLAVGRLVEKKGFDFLIAALAGVKVNFTLTIVGDGPERERLQHLAILNNLARRIDFRGAVTHTELPQIYSETDVVVVPSIQDRSGDRDGLPNVVLEAMASGRALVASEVAAIPSAVVHNENGLLVPPGDPVALGHALSLLGANKELRMELGRNGRIRAQRDYDIRHCSERFNRLLTSVYA
ncbi:MAG TPA: glycosyltransferase family 4 protein [Pyrinomonadaceae bacterium]|nr:glycosyltransferase family 4 protein [Pyrinomonadaceae bacterium]